MFKSGKRRPEEEDSLVPHGMIWYGNPETPTEPRHDTPETPTEPRHGTPETPTESRHGTPETPPEPRHGAPETAPEPRRGTPETPPEPRHGTPETSPESSDESLESTIRYAQVMGMMRRRARAPAHAREENGPQSEPATGTTRPAPIPWWRIPYPDPDAQPPALSSQTDAVTPHPKLALPLKTEAVTVNAPSRTAVSSNSTAIREVKNEVKEIKEVKNDVEQEESARAQALAWTSSRAVINLARSSLAHSRRLAADGKRLFFEAAAKAIRERAPRWKLPRLRIVLTGLPLRIKILLTRQLSEWKMRNPSATPDTRLRNAVIMAAAFAVLGLVGLSIAPHFAARFLPSHALPSGSTVGSKTVGASPPAVAQPSRSAVAAGPESPENRKSHSPTPAVAKSQEEKPSPQRPEARRRHHRTDNDDYVAPNTYKYYGGSASR